MDLQHITEQFREELLSFQKEFTAENQYFDRLADLVFNYACALSSQWVNPLHIYGQYSYMVAYLREIKGVHTHEIIRYHLLRHKVVSLLESTERDIRSHRFTWQPYPTWYEKDPFLDW
jgi:hypothetical protein